MIPYTGNYTLAYSAKLPVAVLLATTRAEGRSAPREACSCSDRSGGAPPPGTQLRRVWILVPEQTVFLRSCTSLQVHLGKTTGSSYNVQVLPLKMMTDGCNFHHRHTSSVRDNVGEKKSRKSHFTIFREFILFI